MIKIDIKKFIRDRMWFGWMYQKEHFMASTGEYNKGGWFRLYNTYFHWKIHKLS